MRIMIVEDEALVALEVSSYLEAANYDVVGIADDVESALSLAEEETPDLALVDIQLARGANGLQVAKALRSIGVETFFATGNCPDEKGRGLAIGCLHKPYSDRVLQQALNAAIARMGGREAPPVPAAVHLY
jgi:two-component system, response regulator PdtaR